MISTNNPSNGFFGTIAEKKGEAAAQKAWERAFKAVHDAMPKASLALIRNYLDSVYGRHTADQVLDGTSVQDQIDLRPSRFRKKFAEIQRQTDAGYFED